MKRSPQQPTSGIGWKHLAVVVLVGGVTLSPLYFQWQSGALQAEADAHLAQDNGITTHLPTNQRTLAKKQSLISDDASLPEEGTTMIVMAPQPRSVRPSELMARNFARPAPEGLLLAPTAPSTTDSVAIEPQPIGEEAETAPKADPELAIPAAEPTLVEPGAKEPTAIEPAAESAIPAVEASQPVTPEVAPEKPAQPMGPARATISDDEDHNHEKGPLLPQDPPQVELGNATGWPNPVSLTRQIDELMESCPECQGWGAAVKDTLEHIRSFDNLGDASFTESLNELARLAEEVKPLSKSLKEEEARARLLRAGYAVTRRATIWQQVHKMSQVPIAGDDVVCNRQELATRLAEIDALVDGTAAADAWRKYLRADLLRSKILGGQGEPSHEERELARLVLHKMHSTQLNKAQREFMQTGPLMALEATLIPFAEEPISLPNLLEALEAFEDVGLVKQSQMVASYFEQLRWSTGVENRRLADMIDNYYRNANVRLAISSQLVNRLIPPQQTTAEPVNDVIQEAFVQGDSETSTRLKLILLPDPIAWRMGLEATGQVSSATTSSSGPATFYQDGLSYYRARKLVVVDRQGFHLFNAEAEANANSELTAFETDFDGIPLFGSLARSIARNQYAQKSPLAKAEVEGKIVGRAQTQLDREVTQRLEKARTELQSRLLTPLQKLDLDPTAIALETTAERVIGRYRLAGYDQISSHSPRPQAPGDSLLSLQIHETALNNAIDHLNLGGRRVELMELYREMNDRFQVEKKEVETPDDIPEDVYVTFQEEDPIRIDCEDGRVRITIRLKELSQGTKNRWRNFTVKGYYRPDANQRDANLVRDGIIELSGQKLRIGDRTVLNGIFARVMSRNRKLNLVNKRLAESPQLKDQMVTQFVVYDGWIGIALGPQFSQRQPLQMPATATRAKEVK